MNVENIPPLPPGAGECTVKYDYSRVGDWVLRGLSWQLVKLVGRGAKHFQVIARPTGRTLDGAKAACQQHADATITNARTEAAQ